MSNIRVLLVTASGEIGTREIPNELHAMQQLVGGYIECVHMFRNIDPSICLVCDEEGVLKGKPRNALFPGIVGDFFLCGTEGDEFRSLTNAQIKCMSQILLTWD